MISVKFHSVTGGTCGWCRKEKSDVYHVTFSDNWFVGPICKGDLLRAIAMKIGASQPNAAVAVNGPAVME
jgi:hypothetical protein